MQKIYSLVVRTKSNVARSVGHFRLNTGCFDMYKSYALTRSDTGRAIAFNKLHLFVASGINLKLRSGNSNVLIDSIIII